MKLLTITLYKLKMMFGDRLFFAAMVIIPLFITIATGYALRYEKMNIIPVAIVNEDNSAYSNILTDRLQKKDGIRMYAATRDGALDMLKGSRVEAVFIIRKDFESKIKSGDSRETIEMLKSPASYSASFIGEVIAGEVIRFTTGNMSVNWVLKQYERSGKKAPGTIADEVMRYYDSQWEPEPLMTIDYKELEGKSLKTVSRAAMPATAATSAGIAVVFIMFYILFSSGWLIEERTNGTLKRLVAGPGALMSSFAGSILALMISGMIQIMLFSLIVKFVFDINLFPGFWSYVLLSVYMLSVISISLFLSSVLKTPAQLQTGAPVFTILTGFAGGCFWNFMDVPKQAGQLALLTPQGWVLEGMNRLLLNPGNAGAILLPACVLLVLSLLLLPLSYAIIKIQSTA